MSVNFTNILLVTFLISATIGYSQNKQEGGWIGFPANRSLEDLQEFKAITKSDTASEWSDGDYIAFYHKGFRAAEELNAQPELIYFSQKLGNIYHYSDSFSQAIFYISYPVDLAYDTISIARAYNRLGYLYFDVGDYNNALKHFFSAVKYGKLLNRGWETYPFGNITNVYKHLEDYDNAIKYTKASIVIDVAADFPDREYGLVYNYTNLLIFNKNKDQTDSCLYYINLIKKNIAPIDTIQKTSFRAAIAYAHTIIADFYIDKDNLNEARKHLDLANRDKGDYNQDDIWEIEGKYWLKRGDYKKVQAIIAAYEAENVQNFGAKEELVRLKIDYYTAVDDFENVATLQEELLTIQQEKFGNNRLRYSAFANAEFENLEQKQRIADLEKQRKLDQLQARNRNSIYLIIFLIVAGGAAFFWYRNRQSRRLNDYLDEQVRLKTKHLEQANYELRTFNYIASHDIKEPIRNIGNYATLAFRRLPNELKSQFEEYFQVIKQSTKQLYTLIEDFAHYTSLSKDTEIDLEPVDLNNVLQSLEFAMRSTVEKYNGIITNNGLPPLQTNASLIYIIFKNLIENGLKYNESAQPTVTLSYQKTATHHHIIIKDNGIGIEADYYEKIFDMFSRLNPRGKYEGSGIGLAIVKLLSNKLRAEIIVDSQIDVGSTFTVSLPRKDI